MPEVSIKGAIIILAAATVVSVAIMILPNIPYLFRRDDTKLRKGPIIVGALMCATMLAADTYAFWLVNTAVEHGLYDLGLPIAPLAEQVRHSPKDQSEEFAAAVSEVGGTPTNTIVVVYRLTCPDCEAVFEDLDARLRTIPADVFWVSSRSSVGEQLRDLYDVTQVPSLIVFDDNGRASVSLAYTKDAAGNSVLDTSVIDIAARTLGQEVTLDQEATAAQETADNKETTSGQEATADQDAAAAQEVTDDQKTTAEQDTTTTRQQ